MIIIEPRNNYLIKEKYELVQTKMKQKKISGIKKIRQRFLNPYDRFEYFLQCVVFYRDDFLIEVKITRMDANRGWEEDVKLLLNNDEIIDIGPSNHYEFKKQFTTRSRVSPAPFKTLSIPKIIIQTGYESDSLNYKKCLDSFLDFNNDYKYIFFDNKDCIKFFQDCLPNHLYYYEKLRPGAFKSDFFRYCYLYVHGGFYFDHKMICRGPIDEFVGPEDEAVLCGDWDFNTDLVHYDRIYNAVIMIRSEHELMFRAIQKCIDNIHNEYYGSSVFDITGPSLLYSCFKELGKEDSVKFKHICYEPYLNIANCMVIDVKSQKVFLNKTNDFIYNPNSGEYHKMYYSRRVFN